MSERTSAARYARALFDVARRESDPVQIERDLSAVVTTIEEHGELTSVLAHPGVPDAARRKIVTEVASRLGVGAPVTKLLEMLVERSRLELLPLVAAVYRERLQESQNIVEAEVTSAAPLAPAAEARLQASLARATGRDVRMKVSVDAALLGGVVARVGSTVYDGSVRTQLAKLRERLVAER
jgi:F-type H+-transporting ATPase subunit delta